MKKDRAWGVFQRITKGLDCDQGSIVQAFDVAWSWAKDDTTEASWEAWVRRCFSSARQPNVGFPAKYFHAVLGEGPDRDLTGRTKQKTMQNASAYQDFESYRPSPESEPDWSLPLSVKIYQWVAYEGGKKKHHLKDPPIELQEAGMAAVRTAIAEWVKQGRPNLPDFNWKAAIKKTPPPGKVLDFPIPLSEGEEHPF